AIVLTDDCLFPPFLVEARSAQGRAENNIHIFGTVRGNEREAMRPTRASHLHETRTPLSSLGGLCRDSENKCVLISKSLTLSPKRALLKVKTPNMGTIPLGRHT
ncbi:hypothetical protein Taro_036742, partial [Colocasia esculenta]|nr:hypothetical protein [Colocasia esculenta]